MPLEGLGDRVAEAVMEERRSQESSRSSLETVKVESLTCRSVCEQEETVTGTSSKAKVLSSRGHTKGSSDQSSCLGEEVESLRQRAGQLKEQVASLSKELEAYMKIDANWERLYYQLGDYHDTAVREK